VFDGSGDGVGYLKLDMEEPWLMRALGTTRAAARALKAQPNVISKIRLALKAQRTGKTLGSCRTTLQGCFGDAYAYDCKPTLLSCGLDKSIAGFVSVCIAI